MPAWLAPLAITVGSQLVSGALNRKKRQPYNSQMGLFDAALRRAGTRGEQVSQEYLERLRNYNPEAALQKATEAQYKIAMPQIQRAVGDLRGRQVGQGRLNTGFGYGDQDRLMQENLQHLNQSLIARAMEAEAMRNRMTSELGAYGQGQQNLFMEGTMGRYMTEEQRRQQEEASKREMWGGLFGAAIGTAGQMYAGRRGYGK